MCKCYDGKGKCLPVKYLDNEDEDSGRKERRAELVFEPSKGRGRGPRGIDKAKYAQQYKMHVVLLDLNANPRYQHECSKCGRQVPARKVVYRIQPKKSKVLVRIKSNNNNAAKKNPLRSPKVEPSKRETRSKSSNASAKKKEKSKSTPSKTVLKVNMKPRAGNKRDQDDGQEDGEHRCQICSKAFVTRKARNMHQLEHKNCPSSSQRPRPRPRERLLNRKKLPTKKLAGKQKRQGGISKAPSQPGCSINDARLVIRLSDIVPRLSFKTDENGTQRLVLKD
jgi:hypothetical protein